MINKIIHRMLSLASILSFALSLQALIIYLTMALFDSDLGLALLASPWYYAVLAVVNMTSSVWLHGRSEDWIAVHVRT